METNISPAPAAVNPANNQMVVRLQLMKRVVSNANWFLWIAGLSVVNTLLSSFNSTYSFIVGLGITQVIDAVISLLIEDGTIQSLGLVRGISVVVDLAFIGLFILFGVFARKGHTWAFIVGIVLYLLDGLIFLLVGEWLSLAFHAFVLFQLFMGVNALGKLKKMQKLEMENQVIQPA